MEDIIFTLLAHERKFKKYITKSQFEELCKEHGVTAEYMLLNKYVTQSRHGIRLSVKGRATIDRLPIFQMTGA